MSVDSLETFDRVDVVKFMTFKSERTLATDSVLMLDSVFPDILMFRPSDVMLDVHIVVTLLRDFIEKSR